MRVLILFLALFFICNSSIANTVAKEPIQVQTPPITQPQNIDYENCTKMFSVNKEKLFYLTLGAITANRFSVDEIQSQNGYIIFSAANNKYLATIANIDGNNSILKITPCNNIYFFPPGILLGMYKYIDLNLNTEIK